MLLSPGDKKEDLKDNDQTIIELDNSTKSKNEKADLNFNSKLIILAFYYYFFKLILPIAFKL